MKLFGKDKFGVLLVLTVLFGFIFRLVNVYTKVLLGDPPHLALHSVNFLDSGLLIVWDQSAYLWYAFTDLAYKLFGISQFASRFASLLFGTLSIIAIYLFTLEFSGNKRTALISAMIYSFFPAFIWHAADEHDISVLFFIILTFYSLIYGLKRDSKQYLVISAVLFGIACMWKAYVPILIIPYLGFIFYYAKTKRYNLKNNYKLIIICLLIIFLLVTPNIVYNYSNYKHNDLPDFLYATHFPFLKNEKVQELYGWTLGGEVNREAGFFSRVFVDGYPDDPERNDSLVSVGFKSSLYSNGKILSLAILISFVYLALKRRERFSKDYLVFYALYFIIPFLILVNGNTLEKHYVHFLAFGAPALSYMLNDFLDKLSARSETVRNLGKRKNFHYWTFALIILYLVFFVFSSTNFLTGSFFSKNPEGSLIQYKGDYISPSSLIVYDDRIYNSAAGWMFNDRYYITVSNFGQLLSQSSQSNSKVQTDIYIIECVSDDCGWGTISSNQPLNESMESFFSSIRNQSVPVVKRIESKVSQKSYYNPFISGDVNEGDAYIIYKTSLPIDMRLAVQARQQYEYFLYPTGYENKQSRTFHNFIYEPSGIFEVFINKFAWLIFYTNIFLSLGAIAFLFYELRAHSRMRSFISFSNQEDRAAEEKETGDHKSD